MADSGVDTDKIARLAKMAEAARLGGKGSIRRKHAPVHKTSSAQDDKRLQQVLKRLSMNVVPGARASIPPPSPLLFLLSCSRRPYSASLCLTCCHPCVTGIDEVNLFKDDDTVIHFSNPKVQMSNGTNTFVVSGTAGLLIPPPSSSSFTPHPVCERYALAHSLSQSNRNQVHC